MNIQEYQNQYREELFRFCLPFWLAHAPDLKFGGIYTCLDRTGKLYSTDKSVWMQGRSAYMFYRMYSIEKRPEYQKLADSCLDFLNRFCIDPTDGRMCFTVTQEGKPLRKRRYFFSETFYILANAMCYRATGREQALLSARRYFDFVLEIFRNPVSDPYKITPKTIGATRDTLSLAEPMILLNVTAVLRICDPERAEEYDKVSRELLEILFAKFYDPERDLLYETVNRDGSREENVAAYRIINPGHSIEAAWFIMNEAEHFNDTALLLCAQKIFDAAFSIGWDKEYGGLLYFTDCKALPVEAYEHDMKLWWPHCEALIASIKLFRLTGNNKYAGLFEMLTEYTFSKFSDRKYGEWYGYLRRDNLPTQPPCKGHTYKGPFHVPRMLLEVAEELDRLIGTQND